MQKLPNRDDFFNWDKDTFCAVSSVTRCEPAAWIFEMAFRFFCDNMLGFGFRVDSRHFGPLARELTFGHATFQEKWQKFPHDSE